MQVVRTLSGFLLTDMNSATGTFVNGMRVHAPTGMFLFPGARISLGDAGLNADGSSNGKGLNLVVMANGRPRRRDRTSSSSGGIGVGGDRSNRSPFQREALAPPKSWLL